MIFTVVEASPPGSAYVPGETLAPSCSPGDTNCKVALTSGSVLFSNGTDLITQDNSNFYWDDTNNRLGIGTTTPSYKLTILGDLFVNTSSTLGNVISGVWQGTAIGDSYVSSAATWNAKITTSSLSVAYSPLSYNNTTGVFSLPTSTASQSGFLSSTDWTTFNNKQNNISFPISVASTSLTASLPLLLTTNDLSLTGRLLTIHNIATSTGSLIAGKADTTGWYGLTVGTDAKVLMASSTATYGMSWETVALTPGGSNTQIQFNNSGSFLGDSNFTWASSAQLLIITGTSTISGNLGVGTTTPVSLFAVATTTNIFNVLSSGYVGIGTSTPAYKLDVAGQIRSSSGGFVFPNNTIQTTAEPPPQLGIDGILAVGNDQAWAVVPSAFSTSKYRWKLRTAPSGTVAIRLMKNGVQFASTTLSGTGNEVAFTSASFVAGDDYRLDVTAADGVAADLRVALMPD